MDAAQKIKAAQKLINETEEITMELNDQVELGALDSAISKLKEAVELFRGAGELITKMEGTPIEVAGAFLENQANLHQCNVTVAKLSSMRDLVIFIRNQNTGTYN